MTTLLVAASHRSEARVCRNVVIGIRGSGEKFYIEEGDIRRQLEHLAGGRLLQQPIDAIHLAHLEKSLEGNDWIRHAEVYFDREDVLHVAVEEREPVARILTTTGTSFYIDSEAHRMPLIEKLTARVPVFTGYSLGTKLNAKDSAFLQGLKEAACTIYNDPFWNAQVGQVDILPDRKLEIIPVIGDHVIRLGEPTDVAGKLGRLLLFYRKVLGKTGFNKYGIIDVQFAGQVIGIRRGAVSAVDSLQLQKNIQELLQRSTLQNVSAEMLPDSKALLHTDSVRAPKPDTAQTALAPAGEPQSNPDPAKLPAAKAPVPEKPIQRTAPRTPASAPVKAPLSSEKPKAVMPKPATKPQAKQSAKPAAKLPARKPGGGKKP